MMRRYLALQAAEESNTTTGGGGGVGDPEPTGSTGAGGEDASASPAAGGADNSGLGGGISGWGDDSPKSDIGGWGSSTANDDGPAVGGSPVMASPIAVSGGGVGGGLSARPGGSMANVELEMELQVSGYNVGLRLFGDFDAGAGDGSAARALDATVGEAAFYEPCEEFGVSRQIAIAEERLGGALATAPFSSRLVTLYADDDFCVVQAGSGDWLAVLERVQGARVEAVEASRRSIEEASRGEIGSIAFDDEGVYLGD